jgi:geranylgeranyl diphosphate synthase, type II
VSSSSLSPQLTYAGLSPTVLERLVRFHTAFDASLEAWIQAESQALEHPSCLAPLWQAIRHSCLLGGKRFRPLLFLEVFRSFKGNDVPWEPLLPVAHAIELVHAQSLVLDDLPCMDNDDLRRGLPTTHKAFGESTAVLVADALMAHSFERLVCGAEAVGLSARQQANLIRELAGVAGLRGLVNGQFADMKASELVLTESSEQEALTLYIYRNKTAALIRFCLVSAGILNTVSAETLILLEKLGDTLGVLFQLVDDCLDCTGTTETLGKTAGKDQTQTKYTLPALLGLEASYERVSKLQQEVANLLRGLSPTLKPEGILELTRFVTQRAH